MNIKRMQDSIIFKLLTLIELDFRLEFEIFGVSHE